MARSMAAKDRLEDVLRIVAAAELRRPLRERLLCLAVEAAVREPSGSSDVDAEEQVVVGMPVVLQGAKDVIVAQEEALDVLGGGMGCRGRPQLPEALRWLRAAGVEGRALAAHLQRQSRLRNAAAHPDVGLVHHVTEFVLGGGAAGHLSERLGSEDVTVLVRGETELLQPLEKAVQALAGVVEALGLRVLRLEERLQADALDLWLAEGRPHNGTVQGAVTVESVESKAITQVASLGLGEVLCNFVYEEGLAVLNDCAWAGYDCLTAFEIDVPMPMSSSAGGLCAPAPVELLLGPLDAVLKDVLQTAEMPGHVVRDRFLCDPGAEVTPTMIADHVPTTAGYVIAYDKIDGALETMVEVKALFPALPRFPFPIDES